MKRILASLSILIMILFCQFAQAQTTGSIGGTITDANGAVLPNATVTVKGASGQEFTATTSDNGTYRIPAVATGLYTVTITSNGFKKSIVNNVKVDVGVPSTVDAALEVGNVEQVVEVTTGAEVLQTQTATVGTTITGRQITETPIASRDALDLVGLLPGTATVGRPRTSSINGLPKGSLSITIDGVDVQDNVLRSSDGFFTYVRPRVDAIDEVTVSTANPGAESGGDGAVQIKFVTRRGTNDYTGGVFWQHRNTALNSAYWFNNRDLKPLPGQTKAPRNVIQLNQYGGRFGGPLPFLNFGEGGGPMINSGKNRSFFFFNYEEFRQPESQTRTRTVLTPDAQNGIFKYITSAGTQQVNLYTIAANAGQLSTPDPTVATVLARIRSSLGNTGVLSNIVNSAGAITDPNRQLFNFTPGGGQLRKFLALRFDVNITKNHSFEFITNQQEFVPSKDFLNSQDERFPGFASYTQGSVRDSYSMAVRSTFGKSIVNEARYAFSTGLSTFSEGISAADFAYSGGYTLGIDAAGITTPYSRNSYSDRNTPTNDFTNNVTWVAGNHSIGFGGQIKLIRAYSSSIGRIVPTVSFGLLSADSAAFNMFSTATLPGASSGQLTEARALYATLIGRVTGYTSTAYLTADGTYKENALLSRQSKQYTYGLFVQDSWRVSPGFTVNYGVRWQPQTAFTVLSGNYAKLSSFADLWGVSGQGNIFKPGTLTGAAPRAVAVPIGEKAYQDDWNNFAPTVGVVWSPNFGDSGFLKSIFGSSGKSVFRGGYSISYVREGFNLLDSILASNPGGTLSASRSSTVGSFTIGTNLRDANNPNLSANPFPNTPAYPITLTTADSANAFGPNVTTGAVHSYSFGYQRELDSSTVVEVRYVGNMGRGLQRQYNLNEFNTIENNFVDEFLRAQTNLYANEAAFAAGDVTRRLCPGFVVAATLACQTSSTNTTPVSRVANFAYFGAGTGTSPLPIMTAYFNSVATNLPNTPVGTTGTPYTPTNFANSTLVAALSRLAPNIGAFSGTSFESSATRRANAIANGLPSNFFYVNPTVPGGAFVVDNSNLTWYDSAVFEVRRRLSQGLRIQASYVFSKAMANAYASSSVVFAGFTQRPGGLDLAKNVQAFDIRHVAKFDATYELPFGSGKMFFGNANSIVNGFLGGWQIAPTIKWQSGSPFAFGNVQLVGMTVKDLQKEIKVRKGPSVVTYLPDDIILNTQKAFNIDVTNIANGGYGTTFGTGGPTGRYIAPAGTGNCVSTFVGKCGFNNLIVYGPSFFKVDVSLSKKINLGEKRNIELRATALDLLNSPNWRVGGWGGDTVVAGVGGSTFGQLASGSAYQDLSTTNDPGGRLIDIMFRFNF